MTSSRREYAMPSRKEKNTTPAMQEGTDEEEDVAGRKVLSPSAYRWEDDRIRCAGYDIKGSSGRWQRLEVKAMNAMSSQWKRRS